MKSIYLSALLIKTVLIILVGTVYCFAQKKEGTTSPKIEQPKKKASFLPSMDSVVLPPVRNPYDAQNQADIKETIKRLTPAKVSTNRPRKDWKKIDNEQCIRYKYRQGDSLVYKLTSTDSIMFEERPTLIRKRTEYISIICDYVDDRGYMFLRQILDSYTATEYTKDSKGDIRRTHPWIGKTTYIIIDSTGKRYLSKQADTLTAVLAPGGAFQPQILLPLLGDSKLCHTSTKEWDWLSTSLDTLAENGYPYPLVRHTYSFAVRDVFDTLGSTCRKIGYAETGQGSVKTITNDVALYMRSMIQGTGFLFFPNDRGYPLAGMIGNNLKLYLNRPNTAELRGSSITETEFMLVYPPISISPNKKTKKSR
jgi:hypothetical protein